MRMVVFKFIKIDFMHIQINFSQRMLKGDPLMREFFNDRQTRGRIDPRDAYYGGMTCAYKMMDNTKDGKTEISMFDIISLYPWVNLTGFYPNGFPTSIIHQQDMKESGKATKVANNGKETLWRKPDDIPFRGLAKIRVIPPRSLYFPVLPLKIDERLIFGLCHKCAERFPAGTNTACYDHYKCTHSDAERGGFKLK